MKNHSSFLIFFMLLFVEIAYADRMSVVIDNDAFVGKDGGGYTNGIRIGWLDDELDGSDANRSKSAYSRFMRSAVEAIPFLSLDKHKKHNAGISIYQMMITPAHITNGEADYYDFPYSGYLATSFFIFEWDREGYDEYSFNLGIVGPASGAGKLQKITHKILNDREPKGWDYQLGNHLIAGVAYEHGDRSWRGYYMNGLETDWVNSIRVQLGNFNIGISGATIWRLGKNYPEDFNVYYPSYPSIIGDSALIGAQRRNNNFGWSVRAGLIADATAYLYVIDEAKDYHIDRNIFSGSAICSGSLYFSDLEISLSMRVYTAPIKQSTKQVSYGSLSVLWHF